MFSTDIFGIIPIGSLKQEAEPATATVPLNRPLQVRLKSICLF